jgi:hypothetical protein
MSKKKRFVKREPRGNQSKKMSIISFGKPEPVLTTGTDYRKSGTTTPPITTRSRLTAWRWRSLST